MDRVTARVRSRNLAAAVALLAFVVPALVLFAYTIAVALTELAVFAASEEFGRLVAVIDPYVPVSLVGESVDSLFTLLVSDPGRLGELSTNETFVALVETTLGSVGFIGGAGLHAFIVLVVAFYLLRDDHRVAAWARATFVDDDSVVERYLVVVDDDLRSIYFGNILNAAFTGLLAAVVFSLLNLIAPAGLSVPQPTLFGLLAGVASLVPVVGIKLVWVPLAVVLAVGAATRDPTTLWFVAVFVLVSVVVVDWIPDQLLRPFVSGRNVHVGAVMLAYIFGPLLWGWYGIFLGPFVLVVAFEFARLVAPWLADPTWTLPGRPEPTPPPDEPAVPVGSDESEAVDDPVGSDPRSEP